MQETQRSETFQHRLEQFNPGMVWLDLSNRITALNDIAMQILGPAAEQSLGVKKNGLLGLNVLQLHPERSRNKLSFILDSQDPVGCPLKSPPPVAMMINIPDKVLMIKASKMVGAGGITGTCMVFYDLTDVTTVPSSVNSAQPVPPRRLYKIPVYRKNRVVLIDLNEIIRFQGDGHYTTITTKDDRFLSNLSLTDLESRLDPEIYIRVHRSHIISIQHIVELVRNKDSVSLTMVDNEQSLIPVSRSKVPQIKDLLGIV
ncbi:LytTR family transcriptional regulator DNA-binding domain-containing protein [Allopusillimonas ginsengisoli]|uniref:LytTR family transcriptional regulator DNA-binding domain-containing protein n=1 Tax=Allopusillimonas ginsengisoli TaxID=453575 RepID=UPI0039C0AEF3